MKLTRYVLILVVLVTAIAASSCSNPNSNYELLKSKNIQCPDGSRLRYMPWGESGMEAVCLLEHGPIAIAEYGHIKIEGQSAMGRKVGEWRWLDASGKVERTERFDSATP